MNPQSNQAKFNVSPEGRGTHRTITEAIASASPGDTIRIQSGVYEEVLILEKPVTLIGDGDGFVLIHHPNFTAIKVRQTEVVLENIALGACEAQISLAADGAKVRLSNCVVAPTRQLREMRASITTVISQSKATSVEPPVSAAEKESVLNAISLMNGAVVAFEGSVFSNVQTDAINSQMAVKNCALVTSQILVHEKALLSVDECRFDCGELSPVIDSWAESKVILCHAQFLGIAGTAIQCEVTALSADNCVFKGTFSTNEYQVTQEPLPANTYWMEDCNLPTDLRFMQKELYSGIEEKNDSTHSLYGRFLGMIGATDGSAEYPDYLYNPVAKKILWAYRKKYNTQAYPVGGDGLLAKAEVLAPLGQEKEAFLQFFSEREEKESQYLRVGIQCTSDVRVKLNHTKFFNLKRAINADCSGEISAEDCLISQNEIGIEAGRSGSIAGVGDGGASSIKVYRTRFEQNVTGFRVYCGSASLRKLLRGDIRYCEILNNDTGLDIMGWSGTVRDCTFEKNATSITLSPFVLTSVLNCKGFGESTSFKVAQTIRRWLPF